MKRGMNSWCLLHLVRLLHGRVNLSWPQEGGSIWPLLVDFGQTVSVLESMNEPMRSLWVGAEPLVATGELHADLIELLDAGLTAVDGGVFFTRELRANGHLRAGDTDLTGQEALINKLHLDDLVDVGGDGWPVICVAQGVLLAGRVFDCAAELSPLPIDVVVSVDSGGPRQVGDDVIETYPSSTFRFFVHREGQPWLSEDLGGFTEAVALLQRR
jgi:hypothetical protein